MSTQVFRYDAGELKKPRRTSQGYLKADALATRTGIFKYQKPDGTVQYELRTPEEVFNHESLDSLAEVPVTNEHPQQPLNLDNTKHHQVGYTGSEISKFSNFVKAGVTITDPKTIGEIEQGKNQLSGGYLCDLEMTPGTYQGQRYDAIQRNIRYNHLAIVKNGRAGPEARLKLDSNDAFMVDDEKPIKENIEDNKDSDFLNPKTDSTLKGAPIMAKLKINDQEFDLPEAVSAHIAKKDSEIENKTATIDMLKADKAKADKGKGKEKDPEDEDDEDEDEEEETDKKDKKKDNKKDKKTKMDAADAIKYGRAFAKAEAFAESVEAVFNKDSDNLLEIQRSVVKKFNPDMKVEEKSDSYIEGAFDYLMENQKNDNAEKLKKAVGGAVNKNDSNGSGHRTDVSEESVEQARFDSMDRMRNKWKQPMSKEVPSNLK